VHARGNVGGDPAKIPAASTNLTGEMISVYPC
jgi:hypothetical protein